MIKKKTRSNLGSVLRSTYMYRAFNKEEKFQALHPCVSLPFNSIQTLSSQDYFTSTVNRMPIVAGTGFLGKDPALNLFRKNHITLIYYQYLNGVSYFKEIALFPVATWREEVAQTSGMVTCKHTGDMASSCPFVHNRSHSTLFRAYPYLFMESLEEKQGPLPIKVVERVNVKSVYAKVLSKSALQTLGTQGIFQNFGCKCPLHPKYFHTSQSSN